MSPLVIAACGVCALAVLAWIYVLVSLYRMAKNFLEDPDAADLLDGQ